MHAHYVSGRSGHSVLHVLAHLVFMIALEVGLTTTIPIMRSCVFDQLAHGCTSSVGNT